MAAESIGVLIPTAIPGYADAADIQAALRVYHYGSFEYSPANTSPGSLVSPSIAKTIFDIETDITALENRPASGGEVDPTEPAPGDFTPPEIPDGFIWVDENGTIGGQPISATAVFTNSVPTSNLSTGVIWVDKDPTEITENPFIPQAVISAKGDILVGTANDTVSVLNTASTNGYILAVNSATTSGLEWIVNDTGDITAVTSGTGITVTDGTGPIPSVAIDTSVTADLTTAQTITNKLLSGNVMLSPEERFTVNSTPLSGTVNLDVLTAGVYYSTASATANWTLNVRGSASTSLDSIMTTNDSITVVVFATQGGTAYYQTVLQVDGNAITPKFQNGVAFVAGNVNSIDIYSFTIIKTGSATFTAFGSQTKFA